MSHETPPNPAPERTPPAPGAPESDASRMAALLEMLFDRNPDGVIHADAQGNLVFNSAAQAMLGLDRAPAEGPIDEWSQKYGVFLSDGKTLHPSETLPLARALKGEVIRDYELIVKTKDAPQGRWVSSSAAPIPGGRAICVFRDVTERKKLEEDLAQRNSELAAQTRENVDLIDRLRLAVDELSTPVLELWEDILALPVVGVVDTVRSARMMEKILAEVVSRRCRSVIIDVTGVDVIDTGTADRFIRIARSIELLGAECVISGVQPAVAQTLTDLGVSFRGLVTQRNLKRALDYCISRQPQVTRRGAAGGSAA